MSAQSQFESPRNDLPASKMSVRSTDVTRSASSSQKPVSSNQGLVPTPTALDLRHFRWCSSHFVSRQWIPRAGEVQFLLITNSSVLPSRAVGEHSPQTQPCLPAVPPLLLHPPGVSALSSSSATDRRPQGAAVSDVKRGKLPGHPALPDK